MKIPRLLIAMLAAALLLAAGFFVSLEMGKSRYNAACSACHSMRAGARSLRVSVHRGRQCVDCHKPLPGLPKMFFRQFFGDKDDKEEIQESRGKGRGFQNRRGQGKEEKETAGGMTAQCRKCHAPIWKKEFIFQNGILFSHARHAKRAPGGCATCHGGIAHPERYVPSRPVGTAVCSNCHRRRGAGLLPLKKAGPKEIPDMHVYAIQPHRGRPNWMIEHKAEAANPRRNCAKCHNDGYCAKCHNRLLLHGKNWRTRHGTEARQDLAECQVCHRPEGCIDCHTNKLPKSHAGDWVARHSKDLDIKNCESCHVLNFCKSCHIRSRPSSHTDVMIRNHAGFSKGKERVCALCHEQNPCMACHKIQMPHPANWRAAHPKQYKPAGAAVCANCHRADFCASCHQKKLPASHVERSTWDKTHGKSALANRSDCSLCHATHFCVSCHNLPMPHPAGWGRAHPREAAAKPRVCNTCHKKDKCAACHQSVKPASHTDRTIDFSKRHGAMARRGNANCGLCHDRKTFCENCHGVPIPHPPALLRDHGPTVKQKGEAACARCHAKAFCKDCHTHRAKHAAGWLGAHGGIASDDSKRCLTCHAPADCLACHKNPVRNPKLQHPDCAFCHDRKTMKFQGTDNCAGCHDDTGKQIAAIPAKKDCVVCHRPHRMKVADGACIACHEMSKEGLHAKSDHADCRACHKAHAWKPAGRENCATCHGNKKNHYEPEPCWTCHSFRK